MKTTGVVRRIDDLGRIVIPKEIRRTLHIRDGESLEIFVEDEMIALKKFSSMNDLNDICDDLVNTLNQAISNNVLIISRDSVISFSGSNKNDYINKNISKNLEKILNDRKNIVEKNKKEIEFIDGLKESCSYTISPIITNGDVIGAVIIFSDNNITDVEVKLAAVTSNFLGRHIEE